MMNEDQKTVDHYGPSEKERYGYDLDHFAGLAMNGWLASFGGDATHPNTGTASASRLEALARDSYAIAAAMIAAAMITERERILAILK